VFFEKKFRLAQRVWKLKRLTKKILQRKDREFCLSSIAGKSRHLEPDTKPDLQKSLKNVFGGR